MAKQTGSIDLKAVNSAGSKAEETAQYFWYNAQDSGAGEGAGVHLTEVPRETFIANPSAGGGNMLITSNSVDIRKGTTMLAEFSSGTISEYGSDEGTKIISPRSEIAIYGETKYFDQNQWYPPNIILDNHDGVALTHFEELLCFTPGPYIVGAPDDNQSDITLTDGTITKVPLGKELWSEHNLCRSEQGGNYLFFENGNITQRAFDGAKVEVSGSVHITNNSSKNAVVNAFLYYYNYNNHTTTEVAASVAYLPAGIGGTVYVGPRIVTGSAGIHMDDYFYLAARSRGTTCSVITQNKDTQMTVKFI